MSSLYQFYYPKMPFNAICTQLFMQNMTSNTLTPKWLLSNRQTSERSQSRNRHPKGQPSAPLVKQPLDGAE